MFKSIKHLIVGILISILVLNTGVFAYEDVPHNDKYFYAIEYLRRNDVFPDKKLFKPNILISKAEYIKYLTLLNSPEMDINMKVDLPFLDTQNNAWYAPYFQEAITLGILNPKDSKVFPYKKLTVMEALELLFHSRHIPIPRNHVGDIPYKDVKKNKRSQAMIMRAIYLGVVQPEKPDYFGLYKRVTRAKAAHMIYKMDLVDLRDPGSSQNIQSYDIELQKIINSWEIIKSGFINRDEIDQTKLSDAAIRAIVEGLDDPYSAYMNVNENQNFSDELDGQFEGMGAFVAVNDDGWVQIIAPIKNSPAYNAGVKAGDIIKKVDDFDTESASLHEVVSKIKGPKGTIVKLTLERNGKNIVIEVTRGLINVPSLEYETVGNNKIMHIKLMGFNQSAAEDFREVTEIITKGTNIKGVILDLRDNPGGLLDVAINILNHILPNDSVAVQIKYNYFNVNQKTTGKGELQDYPMVVLINKGSASASEILAGALKEHGIAKIIGETSFGKGTVQEVNYFPDTSSLKLTVAEWLTPNFNSIQGSGIKPDIEVIQGTSETTDKQLQRAIAEVNKMVR